MRSARRPIAVGILLALAGFSFLALAQEWFWSLDDREQPGQMSIFLSQGAFAGLPMATGDINADGYQDIISTPSLGSAVEVVLGSSVIAGVVDFRRPPSNTLVIRAADPGDENAFVWSADVTGDGIDDVLIGASAGDGPDNLRPGAGEVVVVPGAPGLQGTIDLSSPPPGTIVIYGAEAGDRLGIWVVADDANGDGIPDLLMGADQADGPANDRPEAGEATLILGGPGLPAVIDLAAPPVAVTRIYGADPEDHWGATVGMGDIDGDGYSDLAIAASLQRAGFGAGAADGPAEDRADAGEVRVVFGGPGVIGRTIDLVTAPPESILTVYGRGSADYAGEDLATGDINGDGTRDLVLGAILPGLGYILYGSPSLRGAVIDLATPPPSITTIQITPAGGVLYDSGDLDDINDDGYDDLVAGDAGGRAFVLFGGPSLPSYIELPEAPVGVRSGVVQGATAYTVRAGDVDADGYADILSNDLGEAATYVVSGRLFYLSAMRPESLQVRDAGTGTELLLAWPPGTPLLAPIEEYLLLQGSEHGVYPDTASAATDTSLLVTGLTEGEPAFFRVMARDTLGNAGPPSAETVGIPHSLPSAARGLDATSFADRIALRWRANTELDLRGYHVHRAEPGDTAGVVIAEVMAPETTYTDTSAAAHLRYAYRIGAVDEDLNEGPLSETAPGQLATHDRGVLVVDGARDGSGGPLSPTDEQVDAYYDYLLGGYAVGGGWDVADSAAAARRVADADLGVYSAVVWHQDLSIGPRIAPDTTALRKYLLAGGRLLLTGWAVIKSAAEASGLELSFPSGTFVHDALKVATLRVHPTGGGDYIGARSVAAGYPDLPVDTLKVPLAGHALYSMEGWLSPLVDEPATETLYTYISNLGGSSAFHGLPMGLRHIAPGHKVVVLDMPLFFADSVAARAVVWAALGDLGEVFVGVGREGPQTPPLPRSLALFPNFPNPFRPPTALRFAVPKPDLPGEDRAHLEGEGPSAGLVKVTLQIFNVRGRRVGTLLDGPLSTGYHTVLWDGRDDHGIAVGSGVYLVQIEVQGTRALRKIVLVR